MRMTSYSDLQLDLFFVSKTNFSVCLKLNFMFFLKMVYFNSQFIKNWIIQFESTDGLKSCNETTIMILRQQ